MRAIWSGSLSFGLVNIPVKQYSAVTEKAIDFDMLHRKDFSPIRFARFCKAEEKEIPFEDIVKGYQYEKGRYVVLTDDDFKGANVRLTKTITILDFVNEKEIDPIYFEKPYYLEPDKGAEKPYILLREAMSQSGMVAVGKYVLRNREHLVAIRPNGKIITSEHLRYEEEIRKKEEFGSPTADIDEQEIKIALSLIGQLTRPFRPENYKDTYTNELKRIIKAKVEGRVPAAKGETPKPTLVPDLMATLRKSLDEEKRKKERAKVGA